MADPETPPPPSEPQPPKKAEVPKPSEKDLKWFEGLKQDEKDAAEAFMKKGGWKKWIGEHKVAAPAIPAVITLATLAIPNEKITKDDGTEEEKWGTGKKVAFGTGAVVTVGTLGSSQKWGNYVKIFKVAAQRAEHEI